MASNELDATAKLLGSVLKTVANQLVDKAVISATTAMDVAKNGVDAMTAAAEQHNESVPKSKKEIPNEREFMRMFLESYDGASLPSWNEAEQRFDNVMIDLQFQSYKKGWLANY